VEQEEVVKLVGANPVLGALHPRLVGRNQLGRDLGVEDRLQHPIGFGVELRDLIAQRTRYWISVFGTPAFTP
jgi:hypothetical protein